MKTKKIRPILLFFTMPLIALSIDKELVQPLPFSVEQCFSKEAGFSFKPDVSPSKSDFVFKQQRIGYRDTTRCLKEVYFAKIAFITEKAIWHGPYYCYFSAKTLEGPFEKINVIGQYINGEENGLFTCLHKNGKVSQQVQYKQGAKEGIEKGWNKDGILIRQTTYMNNKKNGSEEFYNTEGKIIKENHYKNGNRDGIQKEYNEDGTIKYEITYKEDSPWDGTLVTGKFIIKLGRPVTYIYEYKDGKIIKESIYNPKKKTK